MTRDTSATGSNRLFTETPQIEAFQKICSRITDKSTYPLASNIVQNVPVYTISDLDPTDTPTTSTLQDEWHHILHTGPGIFVLKHMYSPSRYGDTLESTNAAFRRIIARERQSGPSKGDHFAGSGKNDRIWNSFGKHAVEDPASFVDYYSNPWLELVSEAWLGPAYRVTAQVNVVKPGGAAQDPHRDYHLGFQDLETAARFPATVQLASQFLTLQGAVAHSDMPPESGPTRFLPFSQTYDPGYLAWRREEFRQFFQQSYVAVPLELGDGVFFNPALFHAAGANQMVDPNTDFHRSANLLQISCALGKAMEAVDSIPIVDRCWDVLLARYRRVGKLDGELRAFVRAMVDGYPFPTNLDKRPPAPSGMAPESEQQIVQRGLEEGWQRERVVQELQQMRADSQAS